MRRFRRPGLSLLEVIFAMAIFLTSLAALAQLISMANTAAYEAKYRSLAVQLARSKMAEVRVGAVALDSVGDSPLPDDSDFNWEMDVSSGSVEGLHQVTLRVYRMRPNGSRIEASLSELIIEPTLVGSTLDVAPVISESTPDSSGSALGSGSSSTGSSSGTGMGGTGSSGKTGGTGSSGKTGGTGSSGKTGGTGSSGKTGGTGSSGKTGGTGSSGKTGGTGSSGTGTGGKTGGTGSGTGSGMGTGGKSSGGKGG